MPAFMQALEFPSYPPCANRRAGGRPASSRFVVDTVRTKSKRVSEGTFRSHAIRFTSSLVADEEGEHITLGGCVPAMQRALSAPAVERRQIIDAINALASFCDALTA